MLSTRFTLARAALVCCLTALATSPAVAAEPAAASMAAGDGFGVRASQVLIAMLAA